MIIPRLISAVFAINSFFEAAKIGVMAVAAK